MSRPALLPFSHPLCFPHSIGHHSRKSYNVDISKESNSPLVNPKTASDKIEYLYEHQRISDLINEYCYILDSTSVDGAVFQAWASLFTDDGEATYPFGTHKGHDGLAEWASTAETRFYRMQVCDSPTGLAFHIQP